MGELLHVGGPRFHSHWATYDTGATHPFGASMVAFVLKYQYGHNPILVFYYGLVLMMMFCKNENEIFLGMWTKPRVKPIGYNLSFDTQDQFVKIYNTTFRVTNRGCSH